MAKKILYLLIILTCSVSLLQAQDTLPDFTVKNIGNNRIIISWTNKYPNVKQISIQRSTDSLKNFKTILSVTDPTAAENGYADTKAPTENMFYRLFISLDRGQFFFSPTHRPVFDTSRKQDLSKVDKIVMRDSIAYPNNGVNGNKRHDLFIPSIHVYTHKDGYVRINLPEASNKNYELKFFEEDGRFLFDLKDIRQSFFTLDKSIFFHAGWFNFELFENGILVEKHKFYLPKDF
jgi:hypothetical protein